MRILIAEDNVEELTLITRALEHHGLREIESVSDGREAVERLSLLPEARKESSLKIVVLDLHMPGIDGLGVLSWIKSHDLPVPVVLHTSSENPSDKIKALELGAAAFVPKRAGYQPLIETLLRLVD